MKDAGFYVPAEKRDRFATQLPGRPARQHRYVTPDSRLRAKSSYAAPPLCPPAAEASSPTAQDYYRFAQMLLNSGELDGVRILAPATVELMTSNHLAPSLMTGEFFVGTETMRPGLGYGYDCAVFTDPAIADEIVGKGTFYWLGAADTWFWATRPTTSSSSE